MYLAFLVDDDLDDQKFFLLAVSRIITPAVRCEFARSGMDALDMLKLKSDFNPDFIFLDINMPLMNGMKCLREMRKMKKLRDTPIYMYSTSADEVITTSCISLGATGVIKKLPSINGLKEKLMNIFFHQKINPEKCLAIKTPNESFPQ